MAVELAGPVGQNERISSIDVLRGFALLGILLMNIVGFGLNMAAYDDPTVAGGATGINLWTWIVMHVLAEGKMRCLFSMVFGASFILLTSRLEQKNGSAAADVFYRRNLWLILFGIVHAYMLWAGDILYPYGLCALALYPFRNLSPKSLLTVGGVIVLLQAGANIYGARHASETIQVARQADQAKAQGIKLTDKQEEAQKSWEEMRKHRKPTPEEVEADARKWRGGITDVLKVRAGMVSRWHSVPYYHPWNWDVWSMMLIGMAFMKLGVFSAAWSYRFYGGIAAAGYLVGVSVNSFTAWYRIQSGFDIVANQLSGVTYDLGRLSIALAHMGVIMLLCKSNALGWLISRLGATGQMAFSNYILHSIVCSTIFCGYGFALFGRLERHQLYIVVVSIWVVQMIASPIWLRYFRFGPLEWAWRSLTYWKRQPFRVETAPDAVPQLA